MINFYLKLLKLSDWFNSKNRTKLFQQFFNINEKISLYRAIRLPEGETILPGIINNLGASWTVDYTKAYPYGGKGDMRLYFILHTRVDKSKIDFENTREVTLGCHAREKEIVLLKNIPIVITKIDTVTECRKPEKFKGGEHGWIFKTEMSSLSNIDWEFLT